MRPVHNYLLDIIVLTDTICFFPLFFCYLIDSFVIIGVFRVCAFFARARTPVVMFGAAKRHAKGDQGGAQAPPGGGPGATATGLVCYVSFVGVSLFASPMVGRLLWRG